VGERYNLSLAEEIDGVGESMRLLVFPDILSLPYPIVLMKQL
jgi:hypothetical protein